MVKLSFISLFEFGDPVRYLGTYDAKRVHGHTAQHCPLNNGAVPRVPADVSAMESGIADEQQPRSRRTRMRKTGSSDEALRSAAC